MARKKASATNTPPPTRAETKPRVIKDALVPEARRNSASAGKLARLIAGDEDLNLESDLNINETRRSMLSIDYTKISTTTASGAPNPVGLAVGPTSSAAADTVKKAIDLVFKRANGVWQ
jgi:hypothetical protein